jgi:hypothetical protein
VQGGWLQVPLGSAGASNRPASNLVQIAYIQTKSNGCAMPPGLLSPTLAVRSCDPRVYLGEVKDFLATPVGCPGALKLGDLA